MRESVVVHKKDAVNTVENERGFAFHRKPLYLKLDLFTGIAFGEIAIRRLGMGDRTSRKVISEKYGI
ncbi:MAG: hypothetical protein RDV00_11250 [Clostridia bacterium]|nr:hypothetical protein [Clostridia bacterium]